MMRSVYLTLAIIAAIILGVGGYAGYREFTAAKQPTQQEIPESPPTPTDQMTYPTITTQEQTRGWYWGSEDQKKAGTPSDWIYEEAGKSSYWHAPGVLPY